MTCLFGRLSLQTYLLVELTEQGTVEFSGTSDSELTKGLIALLQTHLSGSLPETVLKVTVEMSMPVLHTICRSLIHRLSNVYLRAQEL